MPTSPPVQVRAADVELLSGSPEGHPVATAARRWAAFDGHTGALHQLNDSSDFVAVQLHGASRICMSLPLQRPNAVPHLLPHSEPLTCCSIWMLNDHFTFQCFRFSFRWPVSLRSVLGQRLA